MGGRYKAYPEYKDSGVEWLGDIPGGWKVVSLKVISNIVNGSTPKSGIDSYWDGDIPWVTPADMGKSVSPYIADGARKITDAGYQSCGTSLVPKGSVILSSRAPIGTLAIAANDLCTNQGCKSLVVDGNIISNFLYFVLLSSTEQLNLLGRGSTFLELSAEDLGSYQLALPAVTFQQKIVGFLDHETAKIDTLIEKQQQLISLLKEKRQAMISHAVAKGLNPNAKMCDSGVEWLGEVPEHWIHSSLKFYAQVIDCKHVTAEFLDDGVPLASIGEVKEKYVNLQSAKMTSEKFYLELISGGRDPRIGDIIYSRNATVGEASLVGVDTPRFAMGQDVCLIRSDRNIDPEFMLQVMKSNLISQQLELAMVGSTFKRINVDSIRSFLIALPPLEEQQEISVEICKRLTKHDRVIEYAESAIKLMQERRTALISAAVTGKIDVRDWVPPAPAHRNEEAA